MIVNKAAKALFINVFDVIFPLQLLPAVMAMIGTLMIKTRAARHDYHRRRSHINLLAVIRAGGRVYEAPRCHDPGEQSG
jgi:hypothetical protein